MSDAEYVDRKTYDKPPEGLSPGQYGFGASQKFSKTAAIQKAMQRKEQSIQKFQDQKMIGMVAFAAARDSAQLATAMVSVGSLKPEDYFTKEEELFWMFVESYTSRQDDVRAFLDELRAKVQGGTGTLV